MTWRSRVIFSVVPRLAATDAGRRRWRGRAGCGGRGGAAAGGAAGWRGRLSAACWALAASSTSCLRIRPPTPVPVTAARSTPCSRASLRTSGVTYVAASPERVAGRTPAATRCGGGAGAARRPVAGLRLARRAGRWAARRRGLGVGLPAAARARLPAGGWVLAVPARLRLPARAAAPAGRGLAGAAGRRRRGRRGGAAADDGQLGADRHGLVLADQDLLHRAGHGRGHLGVDLVGGDLEQRLVDLDGVALGLEPAGDGALGDRLAERRHGDRRAAAGRSPAARDCGARLRRQRLGLAALGLRLRCLPRAAAGSGSVAAAAARPAPASDSGSPAWAPAAAQAARPARPGSAAGRRLLPAAGRRRPPRRRR